MDPRNFKGKGVEVSFRVSKEQYEGLNKLFISKNNHEKYIYLKDGQDVYWTRRNFGHWSVGFRIFSPKGLGYPNVHW